MGNIEEILDRDGVRGALRWLNGRVPHRYTALYERRGETLHNLYVFDKQDPAIKPFSDEPVSDTYCVLVFETESLVQITDASSDGRVLRHPKVGVIQSYCGVPLRLADGEVFGTLCHFDAEPQIVGAAELQVVDEAAQKIAHRLASLYIAERDKNK